MAVIPGQEWREKPLTQLDPVVTIYPQSLYWWEEFFGGGSIEFDTEDIEWDYVLEGAPLAQYVGPELSVDPTERTPFITQGLKTPRMQYKKSISGKDILNRLPGEEMPYRGRDPLSRLAELRAKDIVEGGKAIQNLAEIQRSQLMLGDPIPLIGIGENRYVDYGFRNKDALTGGDQFGMPGVSIIEKLKEKYYGMGTMGFQLTDAIMSPEVWRAMYNDDEIRALLDIRRYEFGELRPKSAAQFGAATFVGAIGDPDLRLWTHNWTYADNQNIRHRYLPPGYMLLISPQAKQNKMGYGAWLGKDPQTKAWMWYRGEYFQQYDDTATDPPRDILTVTSRPIAIPGNIDSWYVFKVLDI
jgi:hypothetical protein